MSAPTGLTADQQGRPVVISRSGRRWALSETPGATGTTRDIDRWLAWIVTGGRARELADDVDDLLDARLILALEEAAA